MNLIAPVSDQGGLVSCEQFLLEGIRLWGLCKKGKMERGGFER